MVNYSAAALDATFQALADGTRRAILARLARSETTVSELARPFDISLPAVSKHLRVLENARLVTRRRDGRVHRCRLQPAALESAEQWIARYRRFWEDRLDALARYLGDAVREKEEPWSAVRRRPRTRSASRAPSTLRARRSSTRGRIRRPS